MTKAKKAEIIGKSSSLGNFELKVFEGYINVGVRKEDEGNSG